MTYLIPNNEIVQVLGAQGEVLGYGFAREGGAGQLQRWIFFTRNWADFPPRGASTIGPPGAASAWAGVRTEEEFIERAKRAWRDGYMYCKAECRSTTNLSSLPSDWVAIDRMFPRRPEPSPFKPDDETGTQSDTGTSEIRKGDALVGYVFTLGELAKFEHWVLLESFEPPSAGAPIALREPTDARLVLPDYPYGYDTFLQAVEPLIAWTPRCTLLLTSCAYYDKVPEPA